jgi:tRNA(Ile)-lysidine synthase
MMPFVAVIQACIETYCMLCSHAKVLVAVSGGPDSMALLLVLHQLRAQYDLTLMVAHINHQLRGREACQDATFVRQQAERLEVPYYLTQVNVKAYQQASGLSPQHAARQLRYASLRTLQETLGATHIALGHTADDQAETLLMRLLRGTGPAGLAGIPAVRFPFIRPLITTHRTAIIAYLQAERMLWIEDSSNAQRTYLRNRIRLDLLPTLQQYNPRIVKRLRALAEMLHADHAVLEQQTEALAQHTVTWKSEQGVVVHCRPYAAAPLALQRRLLRRLLDNMLSPPAQANFQHIEALRQFVVTGTAGKRLGLPGGIMAEHHLDTMLLWKVQSLPVLSQTFTLPVPGGVDVPELNLRLVTEVCHARTIPRVISPYQASVALERLHLPLTVRFPQQGDRFYPLGAPGQKKLRDFFIDNKIPRAERALIPLVVSSAEIVWIVGYRIAEPFKVRPETQYLVHLRCVTVEANSL